MLTPRTCRGLARERWVRIPHATVGVRACAGEELLCNKGHHGPVYGCRFTPDGKSYASAGDDGTIRFWTFAEAEAGAEASAESAVAAPATEVA